MLSRTAVTCRNVYVQIRTFSVLSYIVSEIATYSGISRLFHTPPVKDDPVGISLRFLLLEK